MSVLLAWDGGFLERAIVGARQAEEQGEESMLKSGRCPPCDSTSVSSSQQGVGWDVFLRMNWRAAGMEPFDDWTTYLCTDCGFFENYVTARELLDHVKADPKQAMWDPVVPGSP